MRLHLTVLGLLVSALAMSQDNTIYSEIGIGANANLPYRVPFWFRSNQYGATPLPGASTSVYGSFHKYYDTIDNPLLTGAAVSSCAATSDPPPTVPSWKDT